MQHTQTANAKKEVIEVLSWLGSGTIISEVHKVHDACRFSMMKSKQWDGEEVSHYNHIINSVILFTSCLTQLYIESSTEVVSSPAETEAYGKKLGATPDSIDSDKFLSIG